ncbi:MAG TPA: arylamine N-acetyltransferase [Actinomycetota bacterium]|nr:arylamine N-acetyltransferase [Actinomycetota bacterium]
MDGATVDRYLARIGAERPAAPTADALKALHEAHLQAVPFENLSIHLGEPIVLTEEALVGKLTDRHRGGFCYELNGAFSFLLGALGYEVALLSARVFGDDGDLGPPFDHLVLEVGAGGERWLADVGFGDHSRGPLRAARGEQADPAGTFEVVAAGDDLDVVRDGRPRYRVERRPRALEDFVPTCWWQATSPDSWFRQVLMCSRATATGRITLTGTRLIRTEDGTKVETALPSDQAVLDAYAREFGIRLAEPPQVRAATPGGN